MLGSRARGEKKGTDSCRNKVFFHDLWVTFRFSRYGVHVPWSERNHTLIMDECRTYLLYVAPLSCSPSVKLSAIVGRSLDCHKKRWRFVPRLTAAISVGLSAATTMPPFSRWRRSQER